MSKGYRRDTSGDDGPPPTDTGLLPLWWRQAYRSDPVLLQCFEKGLDAESTIAIYHAYHRAVLREYEESLQRLGLPIRIELRVVDDSDPT